jgi:hypothetical protein
MTPIERIPINELDSSLPFVHFNDEERETMKREKGLSDEEIDKLESDARKGVARKRLREEMSGK